MQKFVKNFIADESGATAIEYGLMAMLIAVGLIVAMGTLKDKIANLFGEVGTALDAADAPE